MAKRHRSSSGMSHAKASKKTKKSKKSKSRELQRLGVLGPQVVLRQGLEYGSETAYQPTLKTHNLEHKSIYPAAGSNYLVPGGSCRFEINTGSREYIKLSVNPIYLFYSVIVRRTPDTAATAAPKDKASVWKVNADDHPNAVLNPIPGPACFIQRADVSINSTCITEAIQTTTIGHLYSSFNRRLATSTARHSDNCRDYLATGHDRNADKKHASLDIARSLVRHASWDDANSKFTKLSIDGIPLLSRPHCHALAALNKIDDNSNVSRYIPPNTSVVVCLWFRNDLGAFIDDLRQTDAKYFKSGAPTGAAVREAYDATIDAVKLAYESWTPKSEKLNEIVEKKAMTYHVDIPHLNTYLLQAGSQHVETSILVPPQSQGMFMAFMYGHSIWSNTAGAKRGCRADFVFPSEIKDVILRLEDYGFLIGERIKDLSGEDGANNPILNMYYDDLRSLGVVDDPFSTFCSPSTTMQSYNQFLWVDLRSYELATSTDLRVTTVFSGTHPCPSNLYIAVCFVGQKRLRKNGRDWSLLPMKKKR